MWTLHRTFILLLCALLALSTACGADDDSYSGDTGASSNGGITTDVSGSPSEGGSSMAPGGGSSTPSPGVAPGQLTAGEWSDLDNWAFWIGLMSSTEDSAQQQGGMRQDSEWLALLSPWKFAPLSKVSVVVKDAQDQVAHDVQVELVQGESEVIWTSRTNHKGEAVLMPGWSGARVDQENLSVRVGEKVISLAEHDYSKPLTFVSQSSVPSDILDIMFVVDATGSMGDEIRYLRAEMQNVIEQVKLEDDRATLRVSFNFYCDDQDDFTVKSAPFSDPEAALKTLQDAPSCGGGDYPEAVDEGLENAIEKHQWSESAKSRLLFLVLDAPPHQDQVGLERLDRAIRAASAKGVRIHPIASSGVDKPTEFLLRAMAIGTGSSYLFLTNDSGIGDAKIEPTIGSYEVRLLNKLLIDVILRSSK